LPLPKKVSLDSSRVVIEWSDGHESIHPNEGLREACPCAMCKGEPPAIGISRVIPLTVAAPQGVRATRYSMVGRYAIAFVWSDGHSTGIYPYDYLLAMCECEACTARRMENGDKGRGAASARVSR
jgi:DUF971 family protein